MATITIPTAPDVTLIHPVENCLEYKFAIADLLTIAVVKASIVIDFQDAEPNVDTETFQLLGKTYTISAALHGTTPYLVDLTSAVGETQADKLKEVLDKSFLFEGTTITKNGAGPNWTITILWCECGPISFINDNDFSGLSFPPVPVITDGSCGTYPRGWRFLYRLYEYDPSATDKPIALCAVNAVNPIIDFDNLTLADNVADICIDIHNELSGRVFSTVPDCTTDFSLDTNFVQEFLLGYGEVFDDIIIGCGVDFGLWCETVRVRFFNGALNIEDGSYLIELAKYVLTAAPQLGSRLFLTDRPQNLPICLGSCAWLKILATADAVIANPIEYSVRIQIYDLLGSPPTTTDSDPAKVIVTDGTIIIPVGPGNLNNMLVIPLAFSAMCKYSVRLRVKDTVTMVEADYSEEFFFPVYNNDCDCKDLSFLGEKGNWETLDTFTCNERTTESNQTEICRSVPCNGTMQADGRKYQILTENKTKLKFESRWYFKTNANLRFLSIFKASESRLIAWPDRYDVETFRPILVDGGSMKVWEMDKKIKVTFNCFLAEMIKQPSEK